MPRYWLWLICFFLFIIESTIMEWMIPTQWSSTIHIAGRLVVVVLIYTSLFVDRYFALALGLVYGLLQDVIFYVYMIGLYTFGMGTLAYFNGLAFRRVHLDFLSIQGIVILGLIVFELYVFSIYSLFGITEQSLLDAFKMNILPSTLCSFAFSVLIYVPIRQYLERVQAGKSES